jgi:HD-like signal output (HDOD) protein
MNANVYQDIEPDQLPLPSGQVMQLVQYITREDVDITTLAEMIALNPVLTTKILRLVNSPLFRVQNEIQTIKDATVVLGLSHLSSLVLCFAVQGALSVDSIENFDVDVFWEDSFRRGVAARLLSEQLPQPIDEAFTAGMLLDMGLLVLFMLEPNKADRWALLRANTPKRRLQMEQELFGTTHEAMGALIAEQWELPQTYIEAIAHHHQNEGTEEAFTHSELSTLMTVANDCNAFFTCKDKNAALESLKNVAQQELQLDFKTIEKVLSDIPEVLREAANAMDINIGEQFQYDSILEQAKTKLVEDNLSFLELTWKLQGTLQERDEYAEKLNNEMNIAREIQQKLQADTDDLPWVAALNIPAMTLSGDFYDYFTLPDGKICFCLGDVSGKGTHAAIMMAKAISLFRCLCKVEARPDKIIELMNNELCETTTRGMFVTFVAAWFDPESKKLELINAGHLPSIIIGGGKVLQVEAKSPPLGISANLNFPIDSQHFESRRLYLYSDGFIECKTEGGEELGINGFLRWALTSSKLAIKDQLAWLKLQFETHATEQLDDLTLLIIDAQSQDSQ